MQRGGTFFRASTARRVTRIQKRTLHGRGQATETSASSPGGGYCCLPVVAISSPRQNALLFPRRRDDRMRKPDMAHARSRAVAGASTTLLASIVNSSDDAIDSKTLDGIITSWNPAAERMKGSPAKESLVKNISILSHPDRPEEMD